MKKEYFARASLNKKYVVHEKCAKRFLAAQSKTPQTAHKDGDFLGVHIHDIRSEYLGRFPVCSHCNKAIIHD